MADHDRPPSSPQASAAFLTTIARVRETLARTSHDPLSLKTEAWDSILKRIHEALDSGRTVTGAGPGRGLPLDVVVQTLKAGWHVDGTWPVGPDPLKELEKQSKEKAELEKGPSAQPDPSPENIANAYRRVGVEVGEAEKDGAEDDW